MRRATILVVALVALAGAAAYALANRGPAVAGKWERLPDAPLSKRDGATGVWTGREVIVFGGVEAPSCPNCSSEVAPVPLRDGAAYDPAMRRWRRIADLPAAREFGDAVVVAGGAVYALPFEGELLAYSIDADRWREIEGPPGGADGYGLTAAGDRLIASSEKWIGEYDDEARRWSRLPPAPAGSVHWTGEDLVALDCVPRPEKEGACLVTGAVLDGDRWEPLPPSRIDWLPGSWVGIDGRLVCACLGDSNSQRQWVGKPAYPTGGILDVKARRWSPLPDPPDTDDIWAGVISSKSADLRRDGFVLDLDRGEWMRMPPHPHEHAHGQTIVTAGRSVFTFGGTRNLKLLGDAWMWTPPPR